MRLIKVKIKKQCSAVLPDNYVHQKSMSPSFLSNILKRTTKFIAMEYVSSLFHPFTCVKCREKNTKI